MNHHPKNEINFVNVESADEAGNPLRGVSGVEGMRKSMQDEYRREMMAQNLERERSRSNKR